MTSPFKIFSYSAVCLGTTIWWGAVLKLKKSIVRSSDKFNGFYFNLTTLKSVIGILKGFTKALGSLLSFRRYLIGLNFFEWVSLISSSAFWEEKRTEEDQNKAEV